MTTLPILTKLKNLTSHLLLLAFPMMSIISIGNGSRFNVSVADVFILLLGILWLIDIKRFNLKQNFPFVWYFVSLAALIILSGIVNMKSPSTGYSGMVSELIKVIISGGYAFCAYNLRCSLCHNLRHTPPNNLPVSSDCNEAPDKGAVKRLFAFFLAGLYVFILYGVYAYLCTHFNVPFLRPNATLSNHYRFLGTQTDPNSAALYLSICFFILTLAINYVFESTWIKRLLCISNVVILVCMLLTQSRGGVIGFVAGLIVLVALNYKRFMKKLHLMIPVVLALIVTFAFDASFLNSSIRNNILVRTEDMASGDGMLTARLNLSLASARMGLDHFLIGAGRGNFPLNSKDYLIELGVDWNKTAHYYDNMVPHNTLAGIFAELGIIGLLLFISLFIIVLIRIIKSDKYDYYLKSILMSMWISIFVQSLAISLENARVIWILAGLLL